MVLPSSGANSLEVYCRNQQNWILFSEAYFKEATDYDLRLIGKRASVFFQGISHPFIEQANMFYSTFTTPFQSGTLQVRINDESFDVFVYPDDRKFTEKQFQLMIEDIMEEASSCFQYSGLTNGVSVHGRTQDIDWTQWTYIDQSFQQLRKIFSRIEQRPFRHLEKHSVMLRREKIQKISEATFQWLDQKGYGHNIPNTVYSELNKETKNVYENQVLKQQLADLYTLLNKYMSVRFDSIAKRAKQYMGIVQRWLYRSFLREVTANRGSYSITQKFRKHPVYKLWYQWFDQLYSHKQKGIGFDYPISLKDTYELYEMWAYMKIVKIFRVLGLVVDTSDLFKTSKEGLFLELAEGKESRIRLEGEVSLYYQRTYRNNTKPFRTYTHMMIPDIVIEGNNHVVILDPKYRIPSNLGIGLGEMHKYRDGIIHDETGERVVKEVYILTPLTDNQYGKMPYFHESFHHEHQMGAIKLMPEGKDKELEEKLKSFVKKLAIVSNEPT